MAIILNRNNIKTCNNCLLCSECSKADTTQEYIVCRQWRDKNKTNISNIHNTKTSLLLDDIKVLSLSEAIMANQRYGIIRPRHRPLDAYKRYSKYSIDSNDKYRNYNIFDKSVR